MIDGILKDEWIEQNASPIWLHQNAPNTGVNAYFTAIGYSNIVFHDRPLTWA
jgi:hypothetical protein